MFSGLLVSDCLLPCSRTSVKVKRGPSGNRHGHSALWLTFNEEVRVKKTSVDRFSFMETLNMLGSNLGLWPGLGLLQLLEWSVGVVTGARLLGLLRGKGGEN